jgi:hypothetical protein
MKGDLELFKSVGFFKGIVGNIAVSGWKIRQKPICIRLKEFMQNFEYQAWLFPSLNVTNLA